MDYNQFIRCEIRKGIDQLDYEILTHQYDDDDIFHYFSESNIFSGGKIIVRPDTLLGVKSADVRSADVRSADVRSADVRSADLTPDKLKMSHVKLEAKLAVRDALVWEEYEYSMYHDTYYLRFPFRDVYYNEPYFLEDRRVYDGLFDLFFGMFFPEREEIRNERLVIRNAVLIVLRDVRTRLQYPYYGYCRYY